jgi:cytochrome b pre-mRNA-processing protein 3
MIMGAAHLWPVTLAKGRPLSTPPAGGFAAMNWLRRRNPARIAAEGAYRRVVAQARQPGFFVDCGVPDTIDGRFELICLHAFLYLYRLRDEQPRAAALGQCFFDTMFADFDRSLRELGTGDLSVGREVKRMAQAFYGRIDAYQHGIEGEAAVLTAALVRNLFGTAPAGSAQVEAMAAYLRREAERLQSEETARLLAGEVCFGACPAPRGTTPAPGCAGGS